MKIYQYINASDVAEWIAEEFKLNKHDVYDTLLNNGKSVFWGGLSYKHEIINDPEKIEEEWMNAFLINFDLNEIQLKYGG